jgi:hypothetical protein
MLELWPVLGFNDERNLFLIARQQGVEKGESARYAISGLRGNNAAL